MSASPYGPDYGPEALAPVEALRESPRHGFQGDRAPAGPPPAWPARLTIAISRETGSRGGSIAQQVGRKLGWQVYTQEVMEYTAQEGTFRDTVFANLPPGAADWATERLERLQREQNLSQHPHIADLARIVLALGVMGEVVLLGRGAGCILPPETTLNVRTVAPLGDRIAYISQSMRQTVEAAADLVRNRDQLRAQFISTYFHRQPGEVYQYDLVLNTSLLGEDLTAEVIVQAARAKIAARGLSATT
jgi:cytidylate kinase